MLNRAAFAAITASWFLVSPTVAFAQVGTAELLVRIDRLENQIRLLTGQLEQMQYRNQQLEAAVKRLQDDNEFRFQELAGRTGSRVTTTRPGTAPPIQPISPGGRRSDAFDPVENPGAPGAPRALGSISPQPAPSISAQGLVGEEPIPRGPMGPSPRTPGAAGPYAVATAPTSSPRDIFDIGNGYLQSKDYPLAEEAFREFLKKYPSDRLAAEAQYGLGESLFQRQSYHDAANAFVVLSKKYETSVKAPDALLRLGQSLAAINEKELACVAFSDVGRKYPRAPLSLKQAIEREQKRVRC